MNAELGNAFLSYTDLSCTMLIDAMLISSSFKSRNIFGVLEQEVNSFELALEFEMQPKMSVQVEYISTANDHTRLGGYQMKSVCRRTDTYFKWD
ncbi:MAG: hypothetical protein WBX01_08960 [Nitrososphaeraceae archaeon]|jgi:hypothetical protein